MSDYKSFNAVVVSVAKDCEVEGKNGTYIATVLTYKVGENVKTKNFAKRYLEKNTKILSQLSRLKSNMKVTVKYNTENYNWVDVLPASEVASASTFKGSSGYSQEGAIKGNCISNAVQLAIANKDTSDAALQKYYQQMVRLHKYAETVGLDTTTKAEVPNEMETAAKEEGFFEDVSPEEVI